MKFNGAIFSKPQQDQLKENIGNELEKVSAKVDEVDARMLNYKGDWVSGDEYHEKDIVTWADNGQLYEVIKSHTSSATIKPDNTEYYKAMTSTKFTSKTYSMPDQAQRELMIYDVKNAILSYKRAITLFKYGERKFLVTWNCHTTISPEGVSGGCISATSDKLEIFKISVDLNTRNSALYSIATDGTITVTSPPIISSITVIFEE